MVVYGDQWPMLLFANQEYDPDNPWEGLFRSQLLVWVCTLSYHSSPELTLLLHAGIQAHLYFAQFGGERSESNAIWQCLYTWHDLCHDSLPIICGYTGTIHYLLAKLLLNIYGQLRFALSSTSVFRRSDTSTDSERFYESVLDFLDDQQEKDEVDHLLNWWNWCVFSNLSSLLVGLPNIPLGSQVFPSYVRHEHGVTKQSALAKLKEKRALTQLQNTGIMR